MILHRFALVAAMALAAAGWMAPARAADNYQLTIKNHRFDPSSLTVPAGKRVKLVVKNADPTAEEFDSDDLHREKVIAGGGVGTLYIGPLAAGTYRFMGEYHAATAQGRIVAK
jgi:plastocyanin